MTLYIDFWKTAFKNFGQGLHGTSQEEIDLLVDAIDRGDVPQSLIQEQGDELLAAALSVRFAQEEVPYDQKDYANVARFPVYPGEEWDGKGQCFPKERLVAALLSKGANPWAKFPQENENHLFPMSYNTNDLLPVALASHFDVCSRASLDAFLRHPACPLGHELDRFQYASGKNLLHLSLGHDAYAVDRFLRAGMDPNRLNSNTNPPLFEVKSAEEAQSLVANGADPQMLNGDGVNLINYWRQTNVSLLPQLIKILPSHIGEQQSLSLTDLAQLLSTLYQSTPSQIKQQLSSIKDIETLSWTVDGQSFNLLDIVVAQSMFQLYNPNIVQTIYALSAKKYAFNDDDRQVLNAWVSFYHGEYADTHIQSLVKKIEKNQGSDLQDNGAMGQKRLLQVIQLTGEMFKPVIRQVKSKTQSQNLNPLWSFIMDFIDRNYAFNGKEEEQWNLAGTLIESTQVFCSFNHKIDTGLSYSTISLAQKGAKAGFDCAPSVWKSWLFHELVIDAFNCRQNYSDLADISLCLSSPWSLQTSSWESPLINAMMDKLRGTDSYNPAILMHDQLSLQESTTPVLKASPGPRRV